MYIFLNNLINNAFIRIRDFNGLKENSFDNNGNYNFGIHDQLIFEKINFDNIDQRRGFNISIITTAKTKEESLFLLRAFGIPFEKK